MSVWNEAGSYAVKITDAQLAEANTGTPQVQLTLELKYLRGKGNEHLEPKPSQFPPRIFLSLTEACMGTPDQPGWVAETLAHIGFKGDFDDLDSLVGWEGDAICQHQDNNQKPGTKRENWSISRPRTPRETVAPEKKAIRSLNTKYGKFFKDAKANGKTNGKPPQDRPTAEGDEANATQEADSIPF